MSLTFTTPEGEQVVLGDFHAFVAGYTGRDAAAVQHHIDELAAIGVPAPPEVPMFYEMDPGAFSTAAEHDDSSPRLTSGEVEPLYIRHAGVHYLGVGSDHTDRDLEREDILMSKRACAKPVGATVVRIDDLSTLNLDDARATCTVDGVSYQRGALAALRTPADVLRRLTTRLSLRPEDDFVCLGGTVPLLDGSFRRGKRWQVELALSGGTILTHTYLMRGTEQ